MYTTKFDFLNKSYKETLKMKLFFLLRTSETLFFIVNIQNNKFLNISHLWLNLWPKEIQSFSINTYTRKNEISWRETNEEK